MPVLIVERAIHLQHQSQGVTGTYASDRGGVSQHDGMSQAPLSACRRAHRLAQLHMRVPDVPLKLVLISLAQDGLLIGFR
jgi:hypothetical protein